MSDSIVSRLFGELKLSVLEEMKSQMNAAMESSFDRAWESAIRKLSQTPPIDPKRATSAAAAPAATTARPRGFGGAGNRAAWGTTKQIIQKAFESGDAKGMTPKMIADWGAAHNMPVAYSSIRTTLLKMLKNQELRRRKDRYMLPLATEAKANDGIANEASGENVHTLRGVA